MSEQEKLTTYEVFIEDMVHVFQERFGELNEKRKTLTEYEKGKWSSYHEILDIIKSREDSISDMLAAE